MRIATGGSVQPRAGDAAAEAWHAMTASLEGDPALVLCAANAAYDPDELTARLQQLAPEGCVVAGATSCLGSMNERGLMVQEEAGLSLFGLAADSPSAFGAGLRAIGEHPEQAAADAVLAAIENAGREGETPDLIWLAAAPGCEERLLEGIASVVGGHVPVMGGSSGDNAIAGRWWQFHHNRMEPNGVLVVAFYTSTPIAVSFHNGYVPTDHSGIVTRTHGRTMLEIDGEPAAETYNRWTDGLIEQHLAGGNILGLSTLHPLGIEAGRIEGVPYFYLLHPERVTNDGGVTLFANVSEGQRVVLMEGSPDSLVRRAGSVPRGLLARRDWTAEQVAGALVVYCAGCMLGVRSRLEEVRHEIAKALPGVPFQTFFTFGEQGCFIDGVNRHGNLMVSVVLFGRES